MKRGIIGTLVIVLSLVIQAPVIASAQAQYTVTQLTNTSSSKNIVASAGNKFIWRDNGNLALYDGTNIRADFAPPVSDLSRVELATMDNENVYYSLMEVYRTQPTTLYRFNIYSYNIATGNTTQITFDNNYDEDAYKGDLQVYDGHVAWTRSYKLDGSQQKSLAIYDIGSKNVQEFFLGHVASNVVVDGTRYAYADAGGGGCANSVLLVRNILTSAQSALSFNKCSGRISLSGQYISWVDRDFPNNTQLIMINDGDTTTQLEANPAIQVPIMAGNKLVWQSCVVSCSVKVYDTSTSTTEVIDNAFGPSTNGTIVMWRELQQLSNGQITFLPKIKDYSTSTVSYLNNSGYATSEGSAKFDVIGDHFFAWVGSKNSATDRNQIVIARPAIVPSAPANLTSLASPTNLPKLTWDSVTNAAQYRVYRDGQAVGTSLVSSFTDNSSIVEGTHLYMVTAISEDNTESVASNGVNVIVDKTAPAVQNLIWSGNPLQQGQNTVLKVTASDAGSGVNGVTYALNGGPAQSMTFDLSSGAWQATLGADLAVNTYDVAVVATDKAGNASPVSVDVLAVYSASNGYVTGHEKLIPSVNDVLPVTRDNDVNHPTQVVLGITNIHAGSTSSGSFDVHYVIKQNKDEFDLSSTDVSWLVVPDSTHASILGHATLTTYINGVQQVIPNVAVRFDLILGTNGNADNVVMKIFTPGTDPSNGVPSWVVNDNVLQQGSQLKIN